MILLIDIGNSRIKWGAWADGAWRAQGALATGEAAALAALVAEWRPAWVGLCCVAGAAVLERVEAALGDLPRQRLVAQAQGHGIVNRYARPESLGADRYAALIACRRSGWAPCVVASAGTALTVDALAGDGVFLGGMILPGAALMRRALAEGTAAVPEAAGQWQAFPRATADAVATGILAAHAGAVAALRQRLAEAAGGEVAVVVTGGDAAALAAHLPAPIAVVPNLVLEGLLWLARDLGVTGA